MVCKAVLAHSITDILAPLLYYICIYAMLLLFSFATVDRLGSHVIRVIEERKLRPGYELILFNQLMAGRQGIQTLFTHINTQLPLAYVHIICLMVKVYILFVDIILV